MSYEIPILLYHDLESKEHPNEKSGLATKGTVVNVSNFEAQMKYLFEESYETISVGEYFELVKKKKNIPNKNIIITFDDGHYSNYDLALPILQKYGFKATFYIIGERIGQSFHLNQDQLKEMEEKGMEIGSHGMTHKFFPDMTKEEMAWELSESKKRLEAVTGSAVHSFAFPGGHYNRKVLSALGSSAFQSACSCLQGLNSLKTSPYLLKRIEVRGGLSLEAFSKLFDPLNMMFYQLIDLIKNSLKKTVGVKSYASIRTKLYKFYPFQR